MLTLAPRSRLVVLTVSAPWVGVGAAIFVRARAARQENCNRKHHKQALRERVAWHSLDTASVPACAFFQKSDRERNYS